MKRNCDYKPCGKEYEAKRDSSKFCSTSCRVMFSRANKGKEKKEAEKSLLLQANVAINSLLEMVGKINFGANPVLEQAPTAPTYNEFKNRQSGGGYLAPTTGETFTVKVVPEKTFAQFQQEKRECENEEDWEKIKFQIQKSASLTIKQKNILINYA